MVAPAVGAFGGIRAPSLARPMLQAAAACCLDGRPVEAAARLKEALRRHMAATARLYALDDEADPMQLFERLQTAGLAGCFVDDMIARTDDVLALRDRGRDLPGWIDLAFELIGDDWRHGGAP